ncbi:G-protein-signaling modulator 2 [Clonorchis sinensis]|uniref:G-protein-signaling modulator 2 n=1 Tax=Clonorchis sinensis TaxID=79923 RepID=H2KNI5_CLOSI|nr:G-protein-signaling modulator 2 [Clonorchis sinensis]
MTHIRTSSPCLELALEGERLCRAGEWCGGISCFRSALSNGTDDLRCLSAIYCQLGNAYFCQKNYSEALEYHRWHLTLARLINDTDGEAKASGNLGHTLKTLGRYDDAIKCFNRQLDIARQAEDQRREARALDELGNAYHAKGEQLARTIGLSDPGEFPVEAADAQRKAVEYYLQALTMFRQLGDRPAEGRVYGNLGNTHYLLGNFHEAIECHKERLNFAREFGDVAAQRRAYSNLGNAFIFLADFNSAAENYRHALFLAQQLKDIALEAQACYSLGNTHGILQDHGTAVVYLLRHLVIARRLGDRVGEGRAHWSLTNEYTSLRRFDLAVRCARRHRQIARELHDDAGFITAQLMIREIKCLLNSNDAASPGGGSSTQLPPPSCVPVEGGKEQHNAVLRCPSNPIWDAPSSGLTWSPRSAPILSGFEGIPATAAGSSSVIHSSRGSGEETEEDQDDFDPDLDADLERELAASADEVLDTVELVTTSDGKTTTVLIGCFDIPEDAVEKRATMTNFYSNTPTFQRHSAQRRESSNNSEDLEDQLENIEAIGRVNSDRVNAETTSTVAEEEEQADDSQEFFSLLLASQSRRMDEQRCFLRATSSAITSNGHAESGDGVVLPSATPAHIDQASNEALFDLIEGMQGDRMDDQRASLPAFPGLRAGPGLQLLESTSLSNIHGVMFTSTGSGASDGLPEPQSRPFSVTRFQRAASSAAATSGTPLEPDAEFLDMILRLQTSTRIDDQRSSLPDPLLRVRDETTARDPNSTSQPLGTHLDSSGDACNHNQAIHAGRHSAPTVPDEDFFALIQRVQATRLDEQRCNPPMNINRSDNSPNVEPPNTVPTTLPANSNSSGNSSQKSTKNPSRRPGGSWRRLSSNQGK